MYNNKYEIGFKPDGHQYIITDRQNQSWEVASWTKVLDQLDKSSALLPWAVNCALTYIEQNAETAKTDLSGVLSMAKKEWRSIKDEACDIGSEVHGIIDRYIKSGLDTIGELRPEVENAFLAFLDWEKTSGVEWVENECRVYNSKVHIAGTFDAIGIIKGKRTLIDFKSSKGFYSAYELQLAGYMSGLMEYDNILPETAGILRLDKVTGIPEWKEYPNVNDKIKVVEKLAEVYYMIAKRRLKNNPWYV